MIPKKALDKNINKAEFTNKLAAEIKNRVALEKEQALRIEIVKRLSALGILLTTTEEAEAFAKERLSTAEVDGVVYVYLDYVDNENQGTLIINYKA
jgi:hypothetical protein